jgi:hypothetical protein
VPPLFENLDLARASYSIACSMKRNEFRFLISQRCRGGSRPHAHRDVGVAAKRSFLHVAVADLDPAHQRMQRLRVRHRFGGAAQIGLGDDLEQRVPARLRIDPAHAVEILVQRFSGVLFEMRPRQPDFSFPTRRLRW